MPTPTPIPITGGAQSSLDELAGAAPVFINAIRGPDGLATRPCVSAWSSFPATFPSTAPVVSVTPFGNYVIYITDDGAGTRNIYALDATNVNAVALSDATTNTKVGGTYRPKTTNSRGYVFISGGSNPSRVSQGLTPTKFTTAPAAKDIATLAQYILIAADDDSGIIYWNLPGDSNIESWDTVFRFAEAEARPDSLQAIQASARELFAFGTRTTQVFVPDPNSYFAPVATMDIGCAARASIVNNDGYMAWLDSYGRIVQSDGRGISDENILSDKAMGRTIQLLSTVSDCWGYREVLGNSDCLVWTFPTAGRTFAWDQRQRNWHERLGWTNGNWSAYPVTAYAWWPERQTHVVGLSNGGLATLSDVAASDLGLPVRASVRAGFMRSEAGRRDPRKVRLIMRKGEAATAYEAIDMRWRDSLGGWGNNLRTTLGTSPLGQNADAVVNIQPVGPPYEERQYEFSWSGRASLVDATEYADEVEI